MNDCVLIPAYKPDKKLVKLVDELIEYNFTVLIVNDGSGEEFDELFSSVQDKAIVVANPTNLGKGAALKKGFQTIRDELDCEYFITADADGQHQVKDIVRVSEALHNGASLVLTTRQFKNAPFFSKLGNRTSRYVYTAFSGHYLSDNQSGLRGFSTDHIEWLLRVDGVKYDYELTYLYYADKQHLPITTLPIETIYIDDNQSSHFDPLHDTLRIYKLLFSKAWVSFFSALLIEILVILTMIFHGNDFVYFTIPTIGFVTSLISVLLNKFVAFRKFRYADVGRFARDIAFRFLVYTLGCLLLSYAGWPLILSFNLTAIAEIIAEFNLKKLFSKK